MARDQHVVDLPPNNSLQRTNGLRPFAAELMIRYTAMLRSVGIAAFVFTCGCGMREISPEPVEGGLCKSGSFVVTDFVDRKPTVFRVRTASAAVVDEVTFARSSDGHQFESVAREAGLFEVRAAFPRAEHLKCQDGRFVRGESESDPRIRISAAGCVPQEIALQDEAVYREVTLQCRLAV